MGANQPVRRLVANRVKQLRLQRGWSQEELAHRTRKTVKHISQVERGQVGAGIDVLASIATGLAVDLADLLPKRSDDPDTFVCLITPKELDVIEAALQIVARARRRRAPRRAGV
jgi:transcriptional regulator with XRE-family HTH domain